MALNRKIANTAGVLLLLGMLLVCVLTGAYFYLPFYLQSRIIPRLASDAGLSDLAVHVRNIGFFSADLGTLRLGPREQPALVIRSIQVDYSPRSLYRKKIEKITLSGIELHGELAEGRLKLRGVDLEKILADAQRRPKTAPASGAPSPPVILERLEVRNSQVTIGYHDQIHRIPFELDVVPQDPAYDRFDLATRLYPRGEEIRAAFQVNRAQRRAALSVASASLNLARFADITARAADLMLSGDMTVHAKAELQWEPFQISSVEASLTLRHGKLAGGGLQLQNAMDANNEQLPWRIDLAAKNTDEWQIRGSRISMSAPVPLTLAGLDGVIKTTGAAIESRGNFSAVLPSSTQPLHHRIPLQIQNPLALQGRFSATYDPSGNWQCDVSSSGADTPAARTVRLAVAPYTVTSSIPEFSLSARAQSANIEAAYKLTVPAVRIAAGTELIDIPKLSLNGTAQIGTGARRSAAVGFDLQAPGAGATLKDGTIKISDISLSGKLNADAVRQISLTGVLQFAGAGGQFPPWGARFDGARGKIPFKWPVTGKTAAGSIDVADLKYKDRQLGKVSSQIHQTAAGFAFEGGHQSALLPAMKLNFSGESAMFTDAGAGTRVHVELSRPADAPELHLGKFFPEAQDLRIGGKFQLNGDLALTIKGFSGMMQAEWHNGSMASGKNNLALEGIQVSLNLPELPKIRSAPGQQLQFARISLGDFVAQKGRIDFQIESARSFLIEKMHFLWCGGNVETQSIRLSPGVDDYLVTFYCDRLSLAQVLEQFGAAAAEGRGSVNGRIPLQYANGKIRFDDGFLFSTPGEGGKIHLRGTDILTAGVPPNTPQYVQMELAREALKDYDYSWTKLNITSQGEELLLQMQMDGKPAKTLPFVYSKDIGGFIKVDAEAKGSNFQGIRLDVNFRLPLNKMLQYKELIKKIR